MFLSCYAVPSEAPKQKAIMAGTLPNHKPKLNLLLIWFTPSIWYTHAEVTNTPGFADSPYHVLSYHYSPCCHLQVCGGGDMNLGKSPCHLCFSAHLELGFFLSPFQGCSLILSLFFSLFASHCSFSSVSTHVELCPVLIKYNPNKNNSY